MIFILFCSGNPAVTSYFSESQLTYIIPQADTFVVAPRYLLKQKEMCSEGLNTFYWDLVMNMFLINGSTQVPVGPKLEGESNIYPKQYLNVENKLTGTFDQQGQEAFCCDEGFSSSAECLKLA